MTRCAVRLMTRDTDPLGALADCQTYWPGFSAAAFSAIVKLLLFEACAGAKAAAQARIPNAMGRFTTALVQAIAPEQAPGCDTCFTTAEVASPLGETWKGKLGEAWRDNVAI